jgi:predicted dehydrogenase
MRDSDVSRRGFLGSAAAGLALTAAATADEPAKGPNDRISVGIVGPGGRARTLLASFFKVAKECGAELTAVCDLWERNRERGMQLVKEASGKEPKVYHRLEDMLDKAGLDAVIIATSDHAHAQQLTRCVQAGKHVYCEKPFANVLEEANAAIDACRKAEKVVVTLGTQRRSDPRYLAAAELVRTGVLGPILRVQIVQNAYSPYRWRRDAEVKVLREKDVDWKAFLMGRPERKFDPRQYLEFRLFHDFSTGIIDQWMTHLIDTVHMLTGAKFPKSAVAHGGTYAWKDHRENGDTVAALLEYPEGFLASYSSTLTNGFGSGCSILGRQGTLEYEKNWRVSGDGLEGLKERKVTEASEIKPKPGLTGGMDIIHMRNWLECVRRDDRQTNCTAEHGYQHAVACILADRALQTGQRMVYDETARTIRKG